MSLCYFTHKDKENIQIRIIFFENLNYSRLETDNNANFVNGLLFAHYAPAITEGLNVLHKTKWQIINN